MAVSYKGLVIKFGGDTTELQAALRNVQKASRDTRSDLKEIDRALKFDPGNTELLEQKTRALSRAYQDTKSQLDLYKQAIAELDDKKSRGIKLTELEERQYDSLKRGLMSCQRKLDDYGRELSEVAREASASKTELYKIGSAIKDNADKIASAGSTISAAGTAVSGGIVGVATAVTAFADSQEEAIQQTAQLETSFERAGGTTEQARSAYASFYRLIGEQDTATEAAQNLARLTTNEQELQAWTDIAAGAFATFGDALPLENLAEAAQETAHTGTVTGGLADALNWSTASADQWSAALAGNSAAQDAFNAAVAAGETKEDAFNAALAACGSEQERASLITETLTGLYGEAGKQYQDTNEDLLASRDAQNELNQSMQELGEAALPVKQAVAEIGSELMGTLAPAIESVTGWYKDLSPEQQELVKNLALGAVAFGGVATAAGKTMEAASGVGSAFQTAGSLFSGAKDAMSDVGFLDKAKSGFGSLGTKAKGVAGTLSGALSSGWTKFVGLIAANPIALGVAAVAAAVAGLTWFFTQTETGKQMWSDFTSWISEKWQGVCDFFSGAGEWFAGVWNEVQTGAQEFADGIGEKWESLKQGASETWEGLRQGASETWTSIKDTAGSLAQGAVDTVSGWWGNLQANTSNAFMGIKSTVSGDLETAKTVGSNAASALESAMRGDWSSAQGYAASAFGAIQSNIETKLENAKTNVIGAANAIGDKLGFPGLGSTVASVFNNIENFIKNPIQNAWNFISDIPNRISQAFSSISINIPRPKLPHFNVSWNDYGPVRLPSVGISWYAKGGIFDGPTVIGVGEAGREAVLPIDRLSDLMASALTQIGGVGQSVTQAININIDLNASIGSNMDAYQTGQQIGAGIKSRLKQRGASIA